MIEVRGVKLSANDRRYFRRGWGPVHWVANLPHLALFLGLVAYPVVVGVFDPPAPLSLINSGVIFGAVVLWWLAGLLVQRVFAAETAKAPTGDLETDWRFDDAGFEITGPLTSSRILWQALKGVREERDRFIFLISPINNPTLPRRFLDDAQTQALRDLIATHVR